MLALENILVLFLALIIMTVLANYSADAVTFVGDVLKTLLGGRGRV